jgi:D-glycero-alpha-D-manno-heptose 1-phosphate guanylyltransferase
MTEAVILAGGQGTRLRAVVADRPKPMAEVAGRPFLEWLVLDLQRQGVGRIVLSTGHQGAVIERHFQGAAPGVVCVREPQPLGTGGGARLALDQIRSARLLVLNGDSRCPFDVQRMLATHARRAARATVWLAPVEDCRRFGTVVMGPDDAVSGFHEKADHAGPGLVNAGVYLFERATLEVLPRGVPRSLEREVLPALVGHGLCGLVGGGPLIDIGTPESYQRARESFREVSDVR